MVSFYLLSDGCVDRCETEDARQKGDYPESRMGKKQSHDNFSLDDGDADYDYSSDRCHCFQGKVLSNSTGNASALHRVLGVNFHFGWHVLLDLALNVMFGQPLLDMIAEYAEQVLGQNLGLRLDQFDYLWLEVLTNDIDLSFHVSERAAVMVPFQENGFDTRHQRVHGCRGDIL